MQSWSLGQDHALCALQRLLQHCRHVAARVSQRPGAAARLTCADLPLQQRAHWQHGACEATASASSPDGSAGWRWHQR